MQYRWKAFYCTPRHRLVVAVLLLTAAVASIVTIACFYALGMNLIQYGVVIDAGSTSSKLMLFKWPTALHKANAAVQQVGKICKTPKGIAAYAHQPANSSMDILHCLHSVAPFADLTEKERKTTNLYLGATAGMRMLKLDNPLAVQGILNDLELNLNRTKYNMPSHESRIRVLTGKEEAMFAWISVNYLKNTFGKFVGSTFWPWKEAPLSSFGALDMGGASAQIAFAYQTNHSSSSSNSHSNTSGSQAYNVTNVTLFGHTYAIVTRSHMCYGIVQMHYRLLAELLKINNYNNQTFNPCGRMGDELDFKAEEIFESPCVQGPFAIDTFGSEIAQPNMAFDFYRFIGTANLSACQQEYIQPLFQTKYFTPSAASVQGDFLAFSAFFYTAKHFQSNTVVAAAAVTSRANYSQAVEDYCRSLVDPKEKVNRKSTFHKWYCFDGQYMLALLQAFGFSDNDWAKLQFVDKVAGSSLSWALGFMIHQSGHLMQNVPFNSFFSLTLFLLLLLFFHIMMLCALISFILSFRDYQANARLLQQRGDDDSRQIEFCDKE